MIHRLAAGLWPMMLFEVIFWTLVYLVVRYRK